MSNSDPKDKSSSKLFDVVSLGVIKLIHFLVFLFIAFGAFSSNKSILVMYSFVIPFLYLHWITNNNICALSLAEKYLREKLNGKADIENCLSCKIIEPIYDVGKNYDKINKFIYGGTFIFWCISLYKLRQLYISESPISLKDFLLKP